MPVRRRVVLALAATTALAPVVAVPDAVAVAVGDRVQWPAGIALVDGRTIAARELLGKTVVVEYWATWCPFCARQNPYVQKLHERTLGSDLVVLTLSIDKTPVEVREYVARRGYTFPVAMATPELQRMLKRPKGLPSLFVVDPSGRVTRVESGEMFEEDVLGLARLVK